MAKELVNSGIEWIGIIPSTWNLCKGKYLFRQRNEKGNRIELQLLSPTQKYGVIPQEMYEELSGMTAVKLDESADFSTLKSIYEGDFCISLRSFQGGFEYSKYNGVVSPAYQVFYKTAELCDTYYRYLFKDQGFISKMNSYTKTFRDGKNISFTDFGNSLIPVPPVEEQKQIAFFLDAECARIDSVIEQTRASIEVYKKLKQVVITRAVTKGIRPDRAMKDSGIPVIGDIPVDWSVQRIKNVAQINGRIGFRGYTTDDLVEEGEGAITLSPSNLCELKMSYAKCSYISWEKYDESPEIQIENGDVLFVKTGSSYGKSSLVSDLPLQATINPQLVVFKNITIDNRFFLYSLQTPSLRNEIEGIVSGGTIPTMGQEKMKNFHLCVPVRGEQIEIADYLDSLCSELDMIISLKGRLIRELEEMKKSLIFEYVTGKKEAPL